MYKKLDAAILNKLSPSNGTFLMTIYSRGVSEEAHRIAQETGRDAYRVVDGRLQALKKTGQIFYCSGKGWMLGSKP